MPALAPAPSQPRLFWWGLGLIALIITLAITSLNVGASSMKLLHLFTQPDDRVTQLLFVSRWPRTLALILSGAALAVSGLILQMLARNRLVDTSLVGTTEAATLGLVVCSIIAPGMALWLKFSITTVFALLGTTLFLSILQRIPLRSALIVPLVGLVLAGVLYAASSLLAHQFELSQALRNWSSGDFSTILRGRYELLWAAAAMTFLAMVLADRFTVIGMGQDFVANVGVNYGRLMALGVLLISMVSASVVITAGILPFIGLIVPNSVRLITGDNLRRAIPLVAGSGSALMLGADLVGRLLIHPYEVPSATLLSIVGSAVFLIVLLRGHKQWA